MIFKVCSFSALVPVLLLGDQVFGFPKVVVSIKPLHSLVSGVMSGIGMPSLLIPGSTSPHTYSMRPSQFRLLQQADLVFWIGPELETFLVKPLKSIRDNTPFLAMMNIGGVHLLEFESVASGIQSEDDLVHHLDPHLWLDPRNARTMVEGIRDALIRIDGRNGNIYQQNTEILIKRLKMLDEEIQSQLSLSREKPYVVFHPAFSYFEERYGLERAGLVMIRPDRPPGARHLPLLKNRIRSRKVICLFSEPQFEPRLVKVLMEGTRVRTAVLDPLGSSLEEGPELYFTLLRRLSRSFRECLLR